MSNNHLWTGCMVALGLVAAASSLAAQKQVEKEQNVKKEQVARKVPVPKTGVAVLHATEGNKVRGAILLTQTDEGVRLTGNVEGLKPGKHGFHIHEFGDLRSPDGKSAGGHFNPDNKKHGSPKDKEHHAGDLGNIVADSQGTAKIDMLAKDLKLHFVIGRAIVVHGGADDFESQPSGDAGPRVALGVIGFAGPARGETRRAFREE